MKPLIVAMTIATEVWSVILGPLAAFYFQPKSIDELVNHPAGKLLDLWEVEHNLFPRWRN
jgi:4-hydroxy-3-polyprenylbenzoate decarboxylase